MRGQNRHHHRAGHGSGKCGSPDGRESGISGSRPHRHVRRVRAGQRHGQGHSRVVQRRNRLGLRKAHSLLPGDQVERGGVRGAGRVSGGRAGIHSGAAVRGIPGHRGRLGGAGLPRAAGRPVRRRPRPRRIGPGAGSAPCADPAQRPHPGAGSRDLRLF